MDTYNKLVRDGIPAIIEADDKEVEIEYVVEEHLEQLLEEKLMEEFHEYVEDKNLEELADMMEVLFGMANQLGYTEEELLAERKKKFEERGGFKEGIFLKRIIE